MNSTYTFGKTVPLLFDTALKNITEALAAEGFGILSDIDVQATLKAKLGQEMLPYRILGACNPPFASQALAMEPELGALLPCNVVVRQLDSGQVSIDIMDPQAVLGLVRHHDVAALAGQVRERLQKALARV